MTTATRIPEGYMEDTMGRLVPKDMVGPVDQLRHELVTTVAGKAKETRARLVEFKQNIFDHIREFVDTASDEIKLLINDAFTVDPKGKLSVRRILSLRNFQITDERWQRAMAAIGDSLTVGGSKEHLRIYKRTTE